MKIEQKNLETTEPAIAVEPVLGAVIENLHRFEMPKIGVYFLFNNDNLIYIGKSINIFRRLNDHIKDKYFDNYSFIKCNTEQEADKLELEMIIKYKPKLNIQHKTYDLDSSIEFHLKSIEKLKSTKELLGIG